MDDSDLDERLGRIERRQKLVLALIVIPYLFGIAAFTNIWAVGVLTTAFGFVALVLVVIVRRRNRSATNG